MALFHTTPLTDPTERWVEWSQRLLLGALTVAGLVLSVRVGWRGFVLLALVPLVFVPFSWARLRLHRQVAPRLPQGWRQLATAAGLLLDAVMLLQALSARQGLGSLLLAFPGLHWFGAVWYSAHGLLSLGYAAGLGLRWLGRRGRRVVGREPSPDLGGELLLGRRELLQRAGLAGAAVPFGISLSGVPLSYDFRVETHEITLPNWPAALDGLRVAHLSDIHVGGAMDLERLLRVAELTNRSEPDLVLRTGDFLTHRSGNFDEPLYEALRRIRAPYGQWACFGNHDFDFPDRFERRLREAGVQPLRNALTRLNVKGQELEVAGFDFVFGMASRRETYARLTTELGQRNGAPRLLLNHDPSAFVDLPEGCADLVLSGHTHGGHIGVQLGRQRALTVVGLAGFPDQGTFARGDMRLFVTRCVGFYGYPMRLGIPPEIALLVLRSPSEPKPLEANAPSPASGIIRLPS